MLVLRLSVRALLRRDLTNLSLTGTIPTEIAAIPSLSIL
jgi:hypothetical protein